MGGGSGGGRRSRVGAGAAETGVGGPLLPETQVLTLTTHANTILFRCSTLAN